MAQLWRNPTMEAESDWDFSDGAVNLQGYDSDHANTGARSIFLTTTHGASEPNNGQVFQTPMSDLTIGGTYTVAAWVNAVDAQNPDFAHSIRAFFYDSDDLQIPFGDTLASAFPSTDTWTWHVFGTFVPDTVRPKVGFITEDGAGAVVAARTFYIDDVALTGVAAGLVAIELGERVIREMVVYYKAQLPTEIAAVDTARGDGVTLAVPDATNYFDYERLEGLGSGEGPLVYLEFFEGDFDFDNPYTDADSGRAVYDIPITVQLTFMNEDGEDQSTVEMRRRRYSVALTEVVRNSITMGDVDASILSVIPGRVEYDREVTQGGNRKTRIRCPMIAKCEEV